MKYLPLHLLLVILIGYTLGVYFPGPGTTVRGKLGI